MLAVFLDIETTGLDPRVHCPIDIALKVVDFSTGREVAAYQSLIKLSPEEWACHDPQSLKINGYSWDKIVDGKGKNAVEEDLVALFKKSEVVRGKAVFICQNPAFDRMFMIQLVSIPIQEDQLWPYHWLDLASMFWALKVADCNYEGLPFPETMTLSKNAIADVCGIPPEEHPHRAINGVDHLMICYHKLFEMRKNIARQ